MSGISTQFRLVRGPTEFVSTRGWRLNSSARASRDCMPFGDTMPPVCGEARGLVLRPLVRKVLHRFFPSTVRRCLGQQPRHRGRPLPIANSIRNLLDQGVQPHEVAIVVRSAAEFPRARASIASSTCPPKNSRRIKRSAKHNREIHHAPSQGPQVPCRRSGSPRRRGHPPCSPASLLSRTMPLLEGCEPNCNTPVNRSVPSSFRNRDRAVENGSVRRARSRVSDRATQPENAPRVWRTRPNC
jgi:hypothetical protein